jgi:ABC-2 type transport system permease protein
MKGLGIAIWAEGLKARKSKMFLGTLIFFIFMGIMMGMLMYVTRHPEIAGRSATMSAKVSVLGKGDWASFINMMLQMVLTIGTIGFGLVTAWIFGREYSEKVIKDIIALPVSRITIVIAKFIIAFIWSFILILILFLVGSIVGLITNMPGWSDINFGEAFGIFLECAFFNLLLGTLVAFVASTGRGYILPIAYVILTLIFTQLIFIGIPSLTIYMPWAFPALYSGIAGQSAPEPTGLSYIIYSLTVILGFILTAGWWRFADQKQ